MEEPFVSIVIPVYNGSNYLREAIDSALMQTYDNCEIIVVNDGSTDGTKQICLSYGDKIRYFEKDNGGVSTALNMGIENMRGEYFSWLSHDDVYYPDKIEQQINALHKCDDITRIVWGDFDIFDSKTEILKHMRFSELDDVNLLIDSIFPILKSYIGGCTLLIHKSHFERVGLFKPELRYTQDYDLWFRMFQGQKILYIPQPLYKLRQHSEQDTVKDEYKMKPNEVTLWLDIIYKVTYIDIKRMFGSLSEFYRQMYIKISIYKNEEASHNVLKTFKEQPPTLNITKSTKAIVKYFSELTNDKTYKLCIFCAGFQGLQLYHELLTLNIKPDSFADNDYRKHGNLIVDGIKCISFNDLMNIKSNVLVVVANKNPNAIVEQLNMAQFPFVATKQQIEKITCFL